MAYPIMFGRKMVQKLTGPDALSISELSKNTEVPISTLSRWLNNSGHKASIGFSSNLYENSINMTAKRPSNLRPEVSDDNPYSESLFRTMKYRPDYPAKAFQSLEQAQSWADDFVCWYNTVHLHSSISFTAPDDRHYGRDENILRKRQNVYEKARQQNPERWSRCTRNWNQVEIVRLNPESENSAGQKQQLKEAV